MLKSKTRLLWIRWHAFVSCFFLPFALLYALTGILYLFGIEGGAKYEHSIVVMTPDVWPTQQQQAEALILTKLPESELPLPKNYYRDGDLHGWWDFHRELWIHPPDEGTEAHGAELHIEHHNLMRQLLWIHKGLAGEILKWLGILMGISILFSLLSGALVSLSLPSLKRQSLVYLTLGSVTLLAAFFAS